MKVFYVISLLCVGAALCKQEETLGEKIADVLPSMPNLDSLAEAYEKAKNTGGDALEQFKETLNEQKRKLEELVAPHREKTWTEKARDNYENTINKLKKWQCQTEEALHKLRFGDAAHYDCEDKSFLEKTKDKVTESVTGAAETTLNAAKDAVSYDDLETAFNQARDKGTEGIRSLISAVKQQRKSLEQLYDEVVDKASKQANAGEEKSKQWLEQFKKQGTESLRKFREMGDEFEQRLQDFAGSDYSRFGWFQKFKFW